MGGPAGSVPAEGLLELRADPLGRDVRVLLAIEPVDTVTLLAVLDGQEAVTEHRGQAIELAGDLLTEIRDGSWPSGDGEQQPVTVPAAAAFLARYFPANADAVTAGAACEAPG